MASPFPPQAVAPAPTSLAPTSPAATCPTTASSAGRSGRRAAPAPAATAAARAATVAPGARGLAAPLKGGAVWCARNQCCPNWPATRRVFGDAPGCPSCCFLKAASGWSRRSAPSLTAGIVSGRGAAAAPPASSASSSPPSPAPSSPPPAAPSSAPASPASSSGGGGGGGGGQCVTLPNTNLQGTVVGQRSVGDAGACCAACQAQPGCNVWNLCLQPGG